MTTKIPASVTRIADLVERSDGLYEFRGETLQQHISVFLEIDSKVNSAQWALAAICASVESKYGEGRVEEFAAEVHYTPRHVRRMAQTYRYWAEQKGRWRPDLSFKHHTEALTHADPDAALDVAQDQNMSSLALREWIDEQPQQKKHRPKSPKRQNEFREFLERVDNLILTDFMVTCPNAEWGRRVFKGWRDDVTWELGQLARTEAAERVAEAVCQGAGTIYDIKQATGLPTKEIEGVVGRKVAEGVWEWIREGGETEVARGTRRMILHIVGEGCFV